MKPQLRTPGPNDLKSSSGLMVAQCYAPLVPWPMVSHQPKLMDVGHNNWVVILGWGLRCLSWGPLGEILNGIEFLLVSGLG